ncbi:unnamed protein product [Leptosia nina]|uniref:Uncharacterized protein n=1 Tax=Leptosia nina TaxID=320188 RepID=A0AAV1K244_9NEOP
MLQIQYLVLVLACASCVYGVPFIKKCKAGDSKCAKESGQAAIATFAAGIKDLGVQTLDPLTLKRTDCSSPNLKLVVTDYSITGLRNCIAKKIKYDDQQSKIFLKLQCSGQLEGNYEMKGRLLFLPLEGKGPLHVTLNKADFNIIMDVGQIEKNGVKHWDIKNWNHGFELKDKSKVVFDNLFSSSQTLGQAAKDVIDESGNEIILEVGSPIIYDSIKVVVESINNFFHSVPLSELVE